MNTEENSSLVQIARDTTTDRQSVPEQAQCPKRL